MQSGKDVRRLLPAVMLGVVSCGCCTWGTRQQQAPLDRPTPAYPRRTDTAPAAPLRIIEPARPGTSTTAVNPVDAPPSLGTTPVANPLGQAPPVARVSDGPAALASAGPSNLNQDLTATRTTVPPTPPATPPQPAPTGGAATITPRDVPGDAALRTTPAPQAAAMNPQAQLRQLSRLAAERYTALDCYQARFIRQEQVGGKDKPREVMLVKFRKQPFSVYFKWTGVEGQGREVVYVHGQHEGKIHTLLADGDMLGMRGGTRFPVAPDSILMRGRTRHPITEAGIGSLVEHFGRLVDAADHGDPRTGQLAYLGLQSRPEFPAPLEAVQQIIPPGAESVLPHGGRRWWFFAADSHLPVLLLTHDEKDHEVEYYCYDSLQVPSAPFTDDDFNPDRLWPKR
jgi:hypothetical protein